MVNCRKSIAIAFLLSAGCGGGGTSSNHTASTPPPVNGVISSASYSNGVVTLNGTDFGTKTTPAPFYFSDFESDLIGQIPAGQMTNTLTSTHGLVKQNVARGARSLEWDYCLDANIISFYSGGHFSVNYIIYYNKRLYTVIANVESSVTTPDLDSVHYQDKGYNVSDFATGQHYSAGQILRRNNGSGYSYFTVISDIASSSSIPDNDPTHYYPGIPGSHCTNANYGDDFQRNVIDIGSGGADKIYLSMWVYLDKGASTTSHSWQWKNFIATSATSFYTPRIAGDTTAYIIDWYTDPIWGGGGDHGDMYYNYNGSDFNINTGLTGEPSDALAWNQWQRLEIYVQRSSAGGVADAIMYENRIGRTTPTCNFTNMISHVAGDLPWRYVDLSNGIASVFTGYLNLKVYMDDVYLDTTQARVEMCDSSTWSSRSHCELQTPVSWSPTQVKTNFRKGSFKSGDQVYFYTVGDTGLVSNASSAFTVP